VAALPAGEAAPAAQFLHPGPAAQVPSEMDSPNAAAVITEMEPPEAAMVLSEMDSDDRTDVLGHVAPERREQLLGEMDAPQAAEVRRLRQYPPDSAGGIMSTQVTALPQDLTIEQAIAELRRLNETLEQMFYVYVVYEKGRLVGVLSMRDRSLDRPGRKMRDIMR